MGAQDLNKKRKILAVNIGGAKNYKLLAIKEKLLYTVGYIVLQNLLKIIKQVKFAKKFECTIHNFFTPQTVFDKSKFFIIFIIIFIVQQIYISTISKIFFTINLTKIV